VIDPPPCSDDFYPPLEPMEVYESGGNPDCEHLFPAWSTAKLPGGGWHFYTKCLRCGMEQWG